MAASVIQHQWAEKRHLITAAIRKQHENSVHAEVAESTLAVLASSVREPTTLMEGVDRALELLSKRATRYNSRVDPQNEVDYPLIVVRGPEQMNELVVFACELGFYDVVKHRITIAGWQRLDELRATRPSSLQAFVAMWFTPEMNDAWLSGFKPGIEDSKRFHALRIDKKEHNNKIDDEIVAEIRRSGLLVADFTGDRGGVYFEAGLAQGIGLPVIWTCREEWFNKVHFDTRQYSHIVWREPKDLRESLDNRIRASLKVV